MFRRKFVNNITLILRVVCTLPHIIIFGFNTACRDNWKNGLLVGDFIFKHNEGIIMQAVKQEALNTIACLPKDAGMEEGCRMW
jgi:hypothetical protein